MKLSLKREAVSDLVFILNIGYFGSGLFAFAFFLNVKA